MAATSPPCGGSLRHFSGRLRRFFAAALRYATGVPPLPNPPRDRVQVSVFVTNDQNPWSNSGSPVAAMRVSSLVLRSSPFG